jgi:hypothetical protein
MPGGLPVSLDLRGDLPCARCSYNLKGLTIRGVCPECATPVRATLLVAVDPEAQELQPLHAPWLTAHGLIVWTLGALLSAMCIWGLRIADMTNESTQPVLRAMVVIFAGCSGLGSIVLIRPHPKMRRMHCVLAAVGVLLYVPLCFLLWRLHVRMEPFAPAPYGAGAGMTPAAGLLRVTTLAVLAAIILCLRLNARNLWSRSLLLRAGKVDRQTMAAMVAVVGVMSTGLAIVLASSVTSGGAAMDLLRQAGQLVVLISGAVITIALFGMVVDSIRVRSVILQPPLTLREVFMGTAKTRAVQADGSGVGARSDEGSPAGTVPAARG